MKPGLENVFLTIHVTPEVLMYERWHNMPEGVGELVGSLKSIKRGATIVKELKSGHIVHSERGKACSHFVEACQWFKPVDQLKIM